MLPIELPLSSSFFNCIVSLSFYKSDLRFLRLFSPKVISKRSENKKMIVHEKDNGKKKRWWTGLFSCYGDPDVCDIDGDNKELVRKPVWKKVLSTITRKKKTVPIEIAGNTMDCETKIRRSTDRNKVSGWFLEFSTYINCLTILNFQFHF
jgi:hypothetical protein